jgi:hypothetical protein
MEMGRRFYSPIDLRSEYEVRVLFGQEDGWATGPIRSPWQREKDLGPLIFWDVTRCRLVVGNRRFGTAYRSHLWGASSTRTAPMLRNIPDGRRLQPHSGSLVSRTIKHVSSVLLRTKPPVTRVSHWSSSRITANQWISNVTVQSSEVLRLRQLVADLSPLTPGFNPRSVHVGFAVDKVAQGQVFLPVFRFSPIRIILPVLQMPITDGQDM